MQLELSSTMIYARAHDQTVAEDYFAAIQRVEERLNIVPEPEQETEDEVVKVREQAKLFQLIEQWELPELCHEERLGITAQLRQVLSMRQEFFLQDKLAKVDYPGIPNSQNLAKVSDVLVEFAHLKE